MVVQLARSGLRVGPPAAIAEARAAFARDHALRLPQFLEPALAGWFCGAEGFPFDPRAASLW